jgi:hypothetical protein
MSALGQSGHVQCKTSCPLCPRKQTCALQLGMSALCNKRTHPLDHRARAAGSQPHLASVLLQGRKSANICARVIRGIPAKCVVTGNGGNVDRSLKAYASCIGLDGDFSLLRDFFGLKRAPPWSNASAEQSYLPSGLSLTTQMKRLHRPFFNIAAISLDGIESSTNACNSIDGAIQLTREIYARAGFGIGRVWRLGLTSEDVQEQISVSNLVHGYGVQGNAIEVFFFFGNYTDDGIGVNTVVGETPPTGDGVTVLLQPYFLANGRTTAHELGHFLIGVRNQHNIIDQLGALINTGHSNNPLNLMCQSSNAQKIPGTLLMDIVSGAQLDSFQRDAIRSNQWVQNSCFPWSIDDEETPNAGYEDPSTGIGSEDPYLSYDTSG